jgi:hypothetical protein
MLVRPCDARIDFLGAPASGSSLVRLLGEWIAVDGEASATMDFAERASQWVSAFDAMGLQSAHQAIRGVQTAARRASAERGKAALAQDMLRARSVLAHAIAQAVPHADDPGSGYGPWRHRHLDLQRQMVLMIEPLRAHVRETASRQSPRLRQLAVLDAAMEQMFARREQVLLPTVPALLKRRFEQLRASASGDESNDGDANDGWLQAFGREWRQALMAELEVRLAPVAGLVEAAADEWNDEK